MCEIFVLQARGGSGEYVWGSTDVKTATVDYHGKISTTGPGQTNVTAADAKNSAHSGTLMVTNACFLSFTLSQQNGKMIYIDVILKELCLHAALIKTD